MSSLGLVGHTELFTAAFDRLPRTWQKWPTWAGFLVATLLGSPAAYALTLENVIAELCPDGTSSPCALLVDLKLDLAGDTPEARAKISSSLSWIAKFSTWGPALGVFHEPWRGLLSYRIETTRGKIEDWIAQWHRYRPMDVLGGSQYLRDLGIRVQLCSVRPVDDIATPIGSPDCRLLNSCYIFEKPGPEGWRSKIESDRLTVPLGGGETDLGLDLFDLPAELKDDQPSMPIPYLVQLRPAGGPAGRDNISARLRRVLGDQGAREARDLDLGFDRFLAPNLYLIVATVDEATVLLTDPRVHGVRRIDPYFILGPELIGSGAEATQCCQALKGRGELLFPPKQVTFPVQVSVRLEKGAAPVAVRVRGGTEVSWPASRLSYGTGAVLDSGSTRRLLSPDSLAQWIERCPATTNQTTAVFVLRSEDDLLLLLKHPEVVSIRLAQDPQFRNATVSWIVQSDQRSLRPLFKAGLRGGEQIVGLIDGLVDTEHCFFADSGVQARKLAAYHSVAGAPPREPASFHGTHVAGILAGLDPERPEAVTNGQASQARIAFRSLDDIDGFGYRCSNLYDALTELYEKDDARILSNSWGDDSREDYSPLAYDVDLLTDRFEDALVVFAASNGDRPKTPENSRNVLAVGAGQQGDDREERAAGPRIPVCDGRIWDPMTAKCVPRERTKCGATTQIAVQPHQHEAAAIATSPGVQVGRRKPELYAPGCWIYSAEAGSGCGRTAEIPRAGHALPEVNCSTSAAAAAVAGGAALVRQYFEHGYYPDGLAPTAQPQLLAMSCNPTGALVKAMLLNGTANMKKVPADRDRYPSFEEGWGRLLLDKSVFLSGDDRYTAVIDRRHQAGLKHGDWKAFRVKLRPETCQELRVTLVWTDPVTGAGADSPVVNDLNLIVKEVGGRSRYYLGNDFVGQESQARGRGAWRFLDPINNVEQVAIAEAGGVYEIMVKAQAIWNGACQSEVDYPNNCKRQEGKQGYALVISGALEGKPIKASGDTCSLECQDPYGDRRCWLTGP